MARPFAQFTRLVYIPGHGFIQVFSAMLKLVVFFDLDFGKLFVDGHCGFRKRIPVL